MGHDEGVNASRWVLWVAAACLVAGCSSAVTGTAVRTGASTAPDVPQLREAQLDDVMLGLADLATIVGASELETIIDSEEMSDNVDVVSEPACLGAIMGAEDAVYAGSGWIAVRDHVVGDPDDEHWIEQTAVLFSSQEQAHGFYGDATAMWDRCAGSSVSVDDTDVGYVWDVGPLEEADYMITQVTTEQDYDDWRCQHAMSQASNLVVETWACAFGTTDGAVAIAERMLENASKA